MRRGKSPWSRTQRIARKACRQPSRMVAVGCAPSGAVVEMTGRRRARSPASCSSGDRIAAAFQHHAGDQGDQGGRGEDEHRPSAPQTRIVRLSVTVRPAPGRDRPVRPELSGDGVRVRPVQAHGVPRHRLLVEEEVMGDARVEPDVPPDLPDPAPASDQAPGPDNELVDVHLRHLPANEPNHRTRLRAAQPDRAVSFSSPARPSNCSAVEWPSSSARRTSCEQA